MEFESGRKSIAQWAEAAPDGEAEFAPAQKKYAVEARIGSGGMGDVLLVRDEDLRRQVAMKVMRPDVAGGRDQRLHFVAEAQATSQLEHPGIPPVHDIGLTEDGRLYFTMKLIQGRTLRDVLRDLLLKRREVHREFTIHRLVGVLQRVCEPIHFGHEKGVIHRDLKPENIMLGDYGEVHVVDWGLARVDESGEEFPELAEIETIRRESGTKTEHGAIKGTISYMSPEQLRGEPLDRRTDVYALGCVLYEMLSLHNAFDSADSSVVARKLSGQFEDVRSRNPRRDVPEALATICEKALTPAREDRYATADELSADLSAWLDGRAEVVRRREEAARLASQGRAAADAYFEFREQVREQDSHVAAARRATQPHAPISEKEALLASHEGAEEKRVERALALAEAQKLLDAALLQDPTQAEAREDLARIWRVQLEDAESRRDAAGEAYAAAMLARYDDRSSIHEGALMLLSEPSAEVVIEKLVPRGGVLVPEDARSLGTTPVNTALEAGSYVCTLRSRGRIDVRYPVWIRRGHTWGGSVELPAPDRVGEEFVHVPAGPFVYGEGRERRKKTLPDFAIQRTPVTFAEYAAFLNALEAAEARRHCPSTVEDGEIMRLDAGRWQVAPDSRFTLDFPVVGIAYGDAEAYCEWKSSMTGEEWRLPTEHEREKAARGVDGRRFAWGDFEDAALAKCRDSRDAPPYPEPSGAFPTATSVYGLVDASGGVWDWTSSWEDDREAAKVARGGSWYTPIDSLHCALRISNPPETRRPNIGFRCVRLVRTSLVEE